MANIESKLSELVSHVPEWLRRDLSASDTTARIRAEETLAAMIASAMSATPERPVSRREWVPPLQQSMFADQSAVA